MSKKKFKREKEKKEKKEKGSVRSSILHLMEETAGRAYSPDQLCKRLGLKKKALIKEVYFILDQLEEERLIEQLSNGSYKSKRKPVSVSGKVDHVNPRFAYVVTGEEGNDIYVATRDLGSALHGDTVTVAVSSAKSGKSREGKVIEVVKRNRTRFVGRLETSANYAFVVPDFKKIYQDFFIYPEHLKGAKANDKVVFEVIKWGEGDKSPEAKVIEILGKTGENDAEIHSIMAEFDLPFRFPDKVLTASDHISEEIPHEEIKKRWDFRETLTFTIDPEDAKDFDDAISLKKLDNGNYEIGVHIADVTHYVKPGTILDDDAFDRATSVYLVDRTVPMLPEKLSNGLCSLRPNEDKLTFAAIFEMDRQGQVLK